MNYLEKFKRLPYCFWKPGFDEPIYKIDKLPSLEKLKKQGACCSGLINLIMLSLSKKAIGGTEEWFSYLINLEETKKIDIVLLETTMIPKGSIVFSNYIDTENQGHIAIVTSDNKLLKNSLITHAIGQEHIGNGIYAPGVIEEKIDKTLFMYTHIFLGDNWIKKNI